MPYAEVIGDPVEHSKSPLIHNFWLEKLGLPGEFRKIRVTQGELGAYLSARRGDPDWRGCSVTLPHKVSILPHLDAMASRAAAIGAANCVHRDGGRLIGTNTDADGINEVLSAQGWCANFVTVIGAGGAARAALQILRERETLEVSMIVRDPDKVRPLHRAFARSGGVYSFDDLGAAITGAECVINASPLGMTAMPPMPEAVLERLFEMAPGGLVFDMVYAPVETELLRRAEALSLQSIGGLDMLIAQAAAAFALFFRTTPPAEHDSELRELLTR